MNYKKIAHYLGTILLIEAVLLLLPVTVGIIYREKETLNFLETIGILAAVGLILRRRKPDKNNLYAKEGYYIVALAWLLMSAFGALPFFISGSIPNYMDAFFETVSGFTTTGSTILPDIESLPKCMLFWRSFTHFIGGMGILVFVLAVMPKSEGSSIHIMKAEVPGPVVGKLVSKVTVTARILYGIYIGLTFILVFLLRVVGLPLFDSIVSAFGTAGTGGFALLNNSIGGYNNPAAEVIISVFMMLFGINFNLYYLLLIKQWRSALKDEELRWYLGVIFAATFIIALDLTVTRHPFAESLRYSFFQVTSIISTTGFASVDYEMWPGIAKAVLFILTFLGACTGSTGGGLKIQRFAVLVKNGFRSVRKAANPRRIESIKLNGRTLEESVVNGITGYFSTLMLIVALSIIIVALDGFDLITTITSVFTCINNVGPGFALVGPSGNFAEFSILSKAILSFDMLAGRLELIPILMLFTRIGSSNN